eukprot:TRINITY_DN2286_c1_g2_i1.p2 TRINITY_DN2286_c1_g2~~TRINITY_DN2286_c1_g2_i1.p2  ORF type:complete len:351 (-),score=132.77 TRINITY_DN2286_c1_g2_i1:891-1862(-)
MSGFFKKSKHDPQEVVKYIKDSLVSLDKSSRKAVEEVSKNLSVMRAYLSGAEHGPEVAAMVANECYAHDLLPALVQNLGKLEFEAKKDAVYIFGNLLRRQIGNRSPTVEYLCRNTEILDLLVKGHEDAEIALSCGAMLRECAKYEPLAKIVLNSNGIWMFFRYVDSPKFDIACDAFATFKEFLSVHKELASNFLEKSYDLFFDIYTDLLKSNNYVTRRQSLKLLGEILLDRANFNVMTKYISSSTNMKLMMTLLRDKSHSIQYEAFHVFKVFVANPNKPPLILEILQKNKTLLIKYLSNFQNNREEEQFNEEKAFLIKQISML